MKRVELIMFRKSPITRRYGPYIGSKKNKSKNYLLDGNDWRTLTFSLWYLQGSVSSFTLVNSKLLK